MEYEGKLYGKVGKRYFPLKSTTEDFESLERQIVELKDKINICRSLLSAVRCPDLRCDNNGTITTQVAKGEWMPEPCEWCHHKKQLLTAS